MNITYDYYRIFYYVAKYQSFTLAANILYSSQPNITRTIKRLEHMLGCTLFVRSNKGVELTPEGERLYSHVAIAFKHIQAGEEELFLENDLHSGLVTISVTEVALHCLILPILKEFHKLYPGVRIRLTNHTTLQALEALKAGTADIAVVTTPTDIATPLTETVIKKIQEVAVCSQCFYELAGKKISFEELNKYPIITFEGHTKSFEFYSNLFAKYGQTLNPDVEVATADQILPLVKYDLGIGFVPTEFIMNDSDRDDFIILDLSDPIPERAICLIKNTEHPLNAAAKQLEKMITAADNI